MAVPLPALPEHLSSGDVQGGEQRRRVVVKFAVCSPLRGGVSAGRVGCMSDQPTGRRDTNQIVHATVQSIIARTEPATPVKNLAAVALGALGGRKGGPARAAALTPERRREIALKGARARWANRTRA